MNMAGCKSRRSCRVYQAWLRVRDYEIDPKVHRQVSALMFHCEPHEENYKCHTNRNVELEMCFGVAHDYAMSFTLDDTGDDEEVMKLSSKCPECEPLSLRAHVRAAIERGEAP